MSKPHLRYKNQTPRERTWTIHFIAIEKIVKGTVLVAVALKLFTLLGQDVHALAADFVSRHGIDVGNKFVHSALERLVGMSNNQIIALSSIAVVYSALLFVEGLGLWFQKRWAEYLTAIGTALLIPPELYEIYERFTWVRLSILILNIFIVWYLATRLRDEKRDRVVEIVPIKSLMPRIKICGITNLQDAEHAISAGADEIGFNFYEKSPRYITPEAARDLVDHLSPNGLKVGVFVNESRERILEIVKYVGLDAIQLHGDETKNFINDLSKSTNKYIIKAARLKAGEALVESSETAADAILLDSFSNNEYGGSGKTFNWELAHDVNTFFCPAYIAGGLTPENVATAIRLFTPYAVDVASGVESSPGKKDPIKVAAFIKAAREAL